MKPPQIYLLLFLGAWFSFFTSACGGVSSTQSHNFNADAIQAYISSYRDLEEGGSYFKSTQLKEVSFSSSIPKNDLILCLKHRNLENVEKLDLSNSPLSSPGQGPGSLYYHELTDLLPRFSHLKNLNLENHGNVSPEVLQSLVPLHGMTHLNIKGCRRLNNDGTLSILAHFQNLTELNISDLNAITDDGVAQLAHMTQMTKLALGGSRNITLDCLRHFGGMNNLTDLSLEKIDLSLPDEHVFFARLPALNVITSRLTSFNLRSDGQITDRHLLYLGRHLNLERLVELNLERSGSISDNGLRELHNLKKLERLKIDRAIGSRRLITRAAVDELLRANPRLDASFLFKYEELL